MELVIGALGLLLLVALLVLVLHLFLIRPLYLGARRLAWVVSGQVERDEPPEPVAEQHPRFVARLTPPPEEGAHSHRRFALTVDGRVLVVRDDADSSCAPRRRRSGSWHGRWSRACRSPPPEDIVDKLRTHAEHRSNGAWERIGGAAAAAETPSTTYRRLRTEMIRAERDEFVRMRDRGDLDDEVLRTVVRDLDLEEAQLGR